jgi:hypothetical protein
MELTQALEGRWKVERIRGLLPPFVYKEIRGLVGRTYLGPVPVGSFDLAGTAAKVSLLYRLWPVRDEVRLEVDGTWSGRAYFFGREFCRFRLVPRHEVHRLPKRPRREERLPAT